MLFSIVFDVIEKNAFRKESTLKDRNGKKQMYILLDRNRYWDADTHKYTYQYHMYLYSIYVRECFNN